MLASADPAGVTLVIAGADRVGDTPSLGAITRSAEQTKELLMFRMILAAMMLFCVLTPRSAAAELKGARFRSMVWLAMEKACAVDMEVTDSVGGMTDGTETLNLGLSYSYSLGGAFSGKTLDKGKNVLFASPSFASSVSGLQADVVIPDADCEGFFSTGGKVSFDGSMQQNPNLFAIDIDPALNKALTEGGGEVDLAIAGHMLYSFTGTWTIGSGPVTKKAADDDGGGCAIGGAPGSGAPLLLLAALGLIRRRRR